MTDDNAAGRPLGRRATAPAATIRAAIVLAGGRCSFPGCSSPRTLDNGLPLLEFAHIASVSPGAPRYVADLSMGDHDLRDNIIVLCPTHHAVVDSSPEVYPVELLRRMREAHIKRVISAFSSQTPAPAPTPAIIRLAEALSIWQRERGNPSEEFWHKFFVEHPEVLAAPLEGKAYTLLSKCYVGGKSVLNSGGNTLDFLAQNKGNSALLEIKTPATRLLSNSPYRANVFAPSKELAGSCIQVLTYRESLIREITSLAYQSPQLRAINPPCIVLIGDLESEALSETQRHSVELFRSSLKDVRVLTYDELFQGAEMLLNALS
ncbi:Shedu anti-phage system protein SduA domain-containing protein [Streptomyces sp. bgisy126]|uniref:Shedu immune nuclease family protein n=1 Tax=unclassified Streptomyces TaxID=2593676 RepID=UPI003EBADDEB